jgi:hypothetical protein
MREFVRVRAQLSSAEQRGDKDSIEFYQSEIDYMKKPIDSVAKSIARGDTTRGFGYLIGVAYYITRDQKKRVDSTIVTLDSTSTMLFTEYMDSALRRTVNALN